MLPQLSDLALLPERHELGVLGACFLLLFNGCKARTERKRRSRDIFRGITGCDLFSSDVRADQLSYEYLKGERGSCGQ